MDTRSLVFFKQALLLYVVFVIINSSVALVEASDETMTLHNVLRKCLLNVQRSCMNCLFCFETMHFIATWSVHGFLFLL